MKAGREGSSKSPPGPQIAAEQAGQQALARFLEELAREELRK
jgi:hypothetical protein